MVSNNQILTYTACKDENSYKGGAEKGSNDGTRKISLKNGLIYEGQLLNGKPYGRGKYIDQSGNIYEGEFPGGTTWWISLNQTFTSLYIVKVFIFCMAELNGRR